jgi:hypothetical protein
MQRLHQLRLGKIAAPRKAWRRDARRPPLLTAAQNAYKGGEAPDGYELARETSTLKFYRKKENPNDVILGVRGTADARDVLADAALAAGLLNVSGRYKADRDAVAAFVKENPGVKIATGGHSLGAAVARELARDFSKHITGGAGYNAAIGLDELLSPSKLLKGKQVRYSTEADFLYRLARPFLPKQLQPTVVDAGKAGSNPLTAHKADNFDATNLGV